MGYQLSKATFDSVLNELKKDYRVYGPVLSEDGGSLSDTDCVVYGEIDRYDDLELDKKSYYSPKEILYPIRETLMYFQNGEVIVPEIDEKPVAIFLRPCDLNGIKRLDTIFLKNGNIEDFYYKRLREKVKFFLIECTEGFDSCFCVSMGSNTVDEYDVAFRFGETIQTDVIASEFEEYFNTSEKIDFELQFIEENKVKVTVPAVEDVTMDIFEHEVWKEYTARCINCGRCNTSCITCSCFTMQDVSYGKDKSMGERRRRWAGCHVNGFTEMAGGHDFRKKNGERMRFKTMHKINDYHKRFGHHMCVGCGRCDDVCPEYISFSKCINKVNDIIKEGK